MAHITGIKNNGDATSVFKHTGNHAPHASGDRLYAFATIAKSGRTFSTATTGWTKIYSQTASQPSVALFELDNGATTSSEAAIVVDVDGAAYDFQVVCFTVTNVDTATTSGIDVASSFSSATDNHFTTGQVTPTQAGDLIVHLVSGSADHQPLFFLPDVYQNALMHNGNRSSVSIASFTQPDTSQTPAHEIISGLDSVTHTTITIAIKDDGNGDYIGQQDPTNTPATLVHPLFVKGTNPDTFQGGDLQHATENQTDPTTLITTLDGATPVYHDLSPENRLFIDHDFPGYARLYSSSAGDRNKPLLVQNRLANAQDYSGGSVLSFTMNAHNNANPLYDDYGQYFGIVSGNNLAARLWKVSAGDTKVKPAAGFFPYQVQVTQSGYEADFGTLDLTDITRFVLGSSMTDTGGVIFAWLYELGTLVMTLGSTTNPLTWADAARHVKTGSLRTVQNQFDQVNGQYYVTQTVQIGNGSTTTIFDMTGQTVGSPEAYDETGLSVHSNVAAGAYDLVLYASANCVFTMNGTIHGGNYNKFSIHASFNTSATVFFQGLRLEKCDITLRDVGSALGGFNFTVCKELIKNDCDLSGGGTIDACVDTNALTLNGATQAALQLLIDDIANCTFSNNTKAIRIEYTGTGDITLNFDGMTFTSNTIDVHYNSTNSSTLTANMQNGSNVGQAKTEVSGSAVAVTVYNDVTLTINVTPTGTNLTLLEENSTTEVYEWETAGTQESYVYTYSTDQTIDINCHKPGYIPKFLDGEVTLSSSDQTVTITLEADPASQH